MVLKNGKRKFRDSYFNKGNKSLSFLDEHIRQLNKECSAEKKEPGQKLLILGMDGLNPNKINALIAKGRLGNFSRLIKRGVSGVLKSTIPPDSLPAWPTFTTGKNAGKHGVIEYFRLNENNEKTVVNSSMVEDKRYWNILNDNGYKTVVVNMPVTFPPEKINGLMVTGHLSAKDSIFTYPESLTEVLKEVGYFTELATTKFFDYDLTEPQPYLYKIRKTLEVGLSIYKNYDWNVFTLAFMTPDKAHHILGLEGEAMDRIYEEMDYVLGKFLEARNEEVSVLILSDHGVANYKKEFSLYPWLYEKELVSLLPILKEDSAELKNKNKQIKKKSKNWFEFIFLKALYVLYSLKCLLNLPSLPFFSFPKEIIELDSKPPCPIDWSKTKAFSILPPTSSYFSITINLKGRQKAGIVSPGKDYEELKSFITNELNNIIDPDTGEKIVEWVKEREEVFSGRNIELMPDLMVKLKSEYMGGTLWNDRQSILKKRIFKDYPEGVLNHHENGFFLWSGSNLKNNFKAENVNICDLAPTILYLFGISVPKDMDGDIKQGIFEGGFVQNNAVKTTDSLSFQKKEWAKTHSDKDMESINNELRRLGYL